MSRFINTELKLDSDSELEEESKFDAKLEFGSDSEWGILHLIILLIHFCRLWTCHLVVK